MKMQEITNFLDEKIENNNNKIVISFYELRIKMNLTEEETNSFLEYSKTRLENLKYKVYKTKEKYIEENKEKIVEQNELLVAIKQK